MPTYNLANGGKVFLANLAKITYIETRPADEGDGWQVTISYFENGGTLVPFDETAIVIDAATAQQVVDDVVAIFIGEVPIDNISGGKTLFLNIDKVTRCTMHERLDGHWLVEIVYLENGGVAPPFSRFLCTASEAVAQALLDLVAASNT